MPARSLNSIPVWAVRSAWSAPVAVKSVVLTWQLTQMNFLALRDGARGARGSQSLLGRANRSAALNPSDLPRSFDG